jgi:hypothetical protein
MRAEPSTICRAKGARARVIARNLYRTSSRLVGVLVSVAPSLRTHYGPCPQELCHDALVEVSNGQLRLPRSLVA